MKGQTATPSVSEASSAISKKGMMGRNIKISEEVYDALETGLPVVALETGYLAHQSIGRDYLTDALAVVEGIRAHGSIPALICITDGKLRVGMSGSELVAFLERRDLKKCNFRDIGAAVIRKLSGTTTLSAALHGAGMAGICVTAAGGIGGVHRDFIHSMDISPDLDAIAAYQGMVISSGPKSILDLAFTAEYLETKGVTVVGYGVDHMPSYYIRESSIPLEYRCELPEEAALILLGKMSVGDNQGMLLTNPIREGAAQNARQMERTISDALKKAERQNIRGKEITVFLMDEIEGAMGKELSDAAYYIKYDNAVLAAKVAVELARIKKTEGFSTILGQ